MCLCGAFEQQGNEQKQGSNSNAISMFQNRLYLMIVLNVDYSAEYFNQLISCPGTQEVKH